MEMLGKGKRLIVASAKAGMDEKTARRYRDLGKLPSDIKIEHTWQTREDPFSYVWEEIEGKLDNNPGLEAKTLFGDLQRRYPGTFSDGQLRTLQRRRVGDVHENMNMRIIFILSCTYPISFKDK